MQGLPVDALFIDEGFGGLDPEALDPALSALLHLPEGGRLLGVWWASSPTSLSSANAST